MFILTFSHTQHDFCFYCLQLNLTAGTNELALIKGGEELSFSLKKGKKLNYGGDEIKREGLKSITNYAYSFHKFSQFHERKHKS